MDKRSTLLICDDSASMLMELSEILQADYKIITARDGVSALRAAQEAPDLILLDVLMPDMSGFDVFKKLKDCDSSRDVPVIFMTELERKGEEEHALSAGAVDFITKPFTPAVVKLRIGLQIKILHQMRTIAKLSMLDHLTELPNRRNFEERLLEEWNRCARDKTTISALVMDIDDFKAYNDTYGHQQGDKALRSIKSVFNKALRRPADFAARWGGEEFIVLLADTNAEGAEIVAEQVRALFEDLEILCDKGTVTKVTMSIGINSRKHDDAMTIDEFISGADMALFQAKKSGKNKVCTFNK